MTGLESISLQSRDLESWILSYLVNALWQVPLLFVAGWAAARALRKLGPGAEHRVWVAALLLQALLPACSSLSWQAVLALFSFTDPSPQAAQPHVSIVMGAGTAWSGLHLPAALLSIIAIVYAGITAWFAAQFIWRWHRIQILRRSVTPLTLTGDNALFPAQCAQAFHIRAASVAESTHVFGPVTIGVFHKLVLLPAGILASLPAAEMRAAIAHEFAHIQRHDFLKNLAYELLTLPVRFHPLFRLARERLMESREMVCDQMAAAGGEPHQYARSLLRLASLLVDGAPARTPHAIGIFDATAFERRVMRLTVKTLPISPVRRLAIAAACGLLGAGICASAMAVSLHIDALAAEEHHGSASPRGPVSVSAEKMQNQIRSKVPPVYPADAKMAGIQGTVKLDAIIGKTGDVEQLKVVSGPKELQQSALDAVRQWTYKPFLVDGDPVDVETTISVIYSLKK